MVLVVFPTNSRVQVNPIKEGSAGRASQVRFQWSHTKSSRTGKEQEPSSIYTFLNLPPAVVWYRTIGRV